MHQFLFFQPQAHALCNSCMRSKRHYIWTNQERKIKKGKQEQFAISELTGTVAKRLILLNRKLCEKGTKAHLLRWDSLKSTPAPQWTPVILFCKEILLEDPQRIYQNQLHRRSISVLVCIDQRLTNSLRKDFAACVDSRNFSTNSLVRRAGPISKCGFMTKEWTVIPGGIWWTGILSNLDRGIYQSHELRSFVIQDKEPGPAQEKKLAGISVRKHNDLWKRVFKFRMICNKRKFARFSRSEYKRARLLTVQKFEIPLSKLVICVSELGKEHMFCKNCLLGFIMKPFQPR